MLILFSTTKSGSYCLHKFTAHYQQRPSASSLLLFNQLKFKSKLSSSLKTNGSSSSTSAYIGRNNDSHSDISKSSSSLLSPSDALHITQKNNRWLSSKTTSSSVAINYLLLLPDAMNTPANINHAIRDETIIHCYPPANKCKSTTTTTSITGELLQPMMNGQHEQTTTLHSNYNHMNDNSTNEEYGASSRRLGNVSNRYQNDSIRLATVELNTVNKTATNNMTTHNQHNKISGKNFQTTVSLSNLDTCHQQQQPPPSPHEDNLELNLAPSDTTTDIKPLRHPYNHQHNHRLCRSGPPTYPYAAALNANFIQQSENSTFRRHFSITSVAFNPRRSSNRSRVDAATDTELDIQNNRDSSETSQQQQQQQQQESCDNLVNRHHNLIHSDTYVLGGDQSPSTNNDTTTRTNIHDHQDQVAVGDKPKLLSKILNDYAKKHPLDKEDETGHFFGVRQPQRVKKTTSVLKERKEDEQTRQEHIDSSKKTTQSSSSYITGEKEEIKLSGYKSLYRKSVDNLKRAFLNQEPTESNQTSNHQLSKEKDLVARMQSNQNHNHESSDDHSNHSASSYHPHGDRKPKEDTMKHVLPDKKQSPISLMSQNPIYKQCNKPLILQYPTTLDNLKLNNTGFTWEVRLPYQQSMLTALSGSYLPGLNRYRLDQFHCHWGADNWAGSEHSVDGNLYTAELHFVHYNGDKYHTMSKAARHPDGLVVLGVFLEASSDHLNHAELEKVTANLKLIPNKGDSVNLKQHIRLDNLLPASNRSYWSYQGSLTTPPYLESVTWFVFKQPIKCSAAQIDKFRQIQGQACCNNQISSVLSKITVNGKEHSRLDHDVTHKYSASSSATPSSASPTMSTTSDDNSPAKSIDSAISSNIRSNHRTTQPLYGRIIYNHDDVYPRTSRL